MPTGADPRKTNVELAATVDNVAISDLATVYDTGAWAVARAAGPVITVNVTIPLINLPSWGYGPGAMFIYGKARYRVDSVAVSSAGTATLAATKLTSFADYQAVAPVETATAFAARWAGSSYNDYAVRPLTVGA